MIYNISFDICASVITLIALYSVLFGRDLGRTSNRVLLTVIVMHLVSCILDIWSSVANSYVHSFSIPLRSFTNYAFLFIHTSEAFVFLCFLLTQLGLSHKLTRTVKCLIAIPEVLMVLLPLALNPLTGCVFTYDSSLIYIHGKAMPLLYGGAILYMIMCIATVIRCRSSLTLKQRRAALLLLLLSAIPILIQSLFMPHQLIEMFFQALGFYGYMQSVENPDEFRHPVTRALNRHSLIRDLTSRITSGIPVNAVVIKLSQVESLRTAVSGSSFFHGISLRIAEWFRAAAKDSNAQFYDCERGIYVLLQCQCDDNNRKNISTDVTWADALLHRIDTRFSEPWEYRSCEVTMPVQIITVKLPDDAISFDSLLQVIFQPYVHSEEGTVFADSVSLLKPLREKSQGYVLPADLKNTMDRFLEGVLSLTRAERNIMNLYIEGYEIGEIPEKAFISMNTVKKHNKNIYRKLGVGSREELMLYVDLFQQYGRINDLYEDKDDAEGTGSSDQRVPERYYHAE